MIHEIPGHLGKEGRNLPKTGTLVLGEDGPVSFFGGLGGSTRGHWTVWILEAGVSGLFVVYPWKLDRR